MQGRKLPSPKQAELLELIQQFITMKGYPPTLRELADATNRASTEGVREILAALERKGYVKRDPGTSRGLRLLEPAA